MNDPTAGQMEALERALSQRRGLRQELDEIRNAHSDFDPPKDEDSDDWMESEYPIIIDIMRDAVAAVLNAEGERDG
jgi:hypothetical protein